MDKKHFTAESLLNDVFDVNGSKIYVENGEIKTILNEHIQQTGYMSVDDCFDLIELQIRMLYALDKNYP